MKSISKILRKEYENEYENEYAFMTKIKNYTRPKIYNARGDISKRWYVYFSYRNPNTGKMERQAPIYLDINRIKDVALRTKEIKQLRNNVEELLINGHIPNAYQTDTYTEEQPIDIQEAFKRALDNAKATMRESSFRDYSQRLKRFAKWLNDRQFYAKEISEITKKTITNYLNDVLAQTSPKNRNNTRANLSIFFSFLEQNDYIKENFVKNIPVLNAQPQRNKTYTPQQEEHIYQLLEQQDPHLHLFIKFVSYNFLRPVEVCRLRIKDIDFENATLSVKAKNKIYKTKIIPKILLQDIEQYKNAHPDFYLFSSAGVGASDTSETQRRTYWGKRFKKIKDQLNLDKDYTIYSFRHTFITKLYRELRRDFPPYETKSRLMLITGHTSMTALEKYLRDIDAELPEDYSDMLIKAQ